MRISILASFVPGVLGAANKFIVSYCDDANCGGGRPGNNPLATSMDWKTAQMEAWSYWDDAKVKAWQTANAAVTNTGCKGKCDAAKVDQYMKDSAAGKIKAPADESTCYCGRAKYCAVKFADCWGKTTNQANCKKATDTPDAECTDSEITAMRIVKGCYDQEVDQTIERYEETFGCEDYEEECAKTNEILEQEEGEGELLDEDYEWDGCGSTGITASWLAAVSLLLARFS